VRKAILGRARLPQRGATGSSSMTILEFFKQQGCPHPVYLGDGAYAGTDGYQVWLVCDRSGVLNYIALDGYAEGALVEYLKKLHGKKEEQE
jgi:hypothetical protein